MKKSLSYFFKTELKVTKIEKMIQLITPSMENFESIEFFLADSIHCNSSIKRSTSLSMSAIKSFALFWKVELILSKLKSALYFFNQKQTNNQEIT